MNAMDAALICRALGDSNRIQIVELLMNGEMCGCRLLEHFQIAQPTLSHHMKVLAECGLVNGRKEWKNTYYSLNCDVLTAFREYIDHLNCGKACRQKSEDRDCCGEENPGEVCRSRGEKTTGGCCGQKSEDQNC